MIKASEYEKYDQLLKQEREGFLYWWDVTDDLGMHEEIVMEIFALGEGEIE